MFYGHLIGTDFALFIRDMPIQKKEEDFTMEYKHLIEGARRIIACGCAKPGEKVLIITDPQRPESIAKAWILHLL